MIDRSRRPASAMFSVRGIGVAVSVSTSTSARSFFSCSLWRTPKRCSSSMMIEPEVLEAHVGCSSRWVPTTMSTVPSRQALQRSLRLLAGAEARQALDPHRPVGEAVAEVLVVLLREQRGRHQHHHLLAALHRREGGAHGDLGLAEADVAADQPVHRLSDRMSASTSSMASAWSGVSSKAKAAAKAAYSTRASGASGPCARARRA